MQWWQRSIVDAGKLPLLLALVAFIVTFVVTRTITRLIRAGRGPFHDISSGGTHIHHAVPGLALMIIGSFTALAARHSVWFNVSAVLIGIGTSLVLDEFALILHLQDDYWNQKGRLSIDLVCLVAVCLFLTLIGFSPLGVRNVGTTERVLRLGLMGTALVQWISVAFCVLKGKYNLALLAAFIPLVGMVGAFRLARPHSVWSHKRYSPERKADAQRRSDAFDARWDPILRRWQNLIGGATSP